MVSSGAKNARWRRSVSQTPGFINGPSKTSGWRHEGLPLATDAGSLIHLLYSSSATAVFSMNSHCGVCVRRNLSVVAVDETEESQHSTTCRKWQKKHKTIKKNKNCFSKPDINSHTILHSVASLHRYSHTHMHKTDSKTCHNCCCLNSQNNCQT